MNGIITTPKARELNDLLTNLFRQQKEVNGAAAYLNDHGRPVAIKHHVDVFCWYADYLPDKGTFLDWGCNHGPDSCLIRKTFGHGADLYACDFVAETEFKVFREYSQPRYSRLTSPIGLPYPENTFDVVIASGVLEHTAMDLEALKSLHHVLKPDGVLVISYLPYRWSWREWYQRRVRKDGFHRRLYGRSETATILKRSGFYPIDLRFQTFIPNVVDGKSRSFIKPLLAPLTKPILVPLRHTFFRHSVICCAARKVIVM